MSNIANLLIIISLIAVGCGESNSADPSPESTSIDAGNLEKSCDNPVIETIQDLEQVAGCTSITGDLNIMDIATEITNLDGLESIQSIEGNLILQAPSLANIDGLKNLTSVSSDVSIETPSLTDLDGLQKLTHIGGNLTIENCFELTDMHGIESLTNLSGKLTIRNLPKLATCDAVDVVKNLGLPVEDAHKYVCGTRVDTCGEFMCVIIT